MVQSRSTTRRRKQISARRSPRLQLRLPLRLQPCVVRLQNNPAFLRPVIAKHPCPCIKLQLSSSFLFDCRRFLAFHVRFASPSTTILADFFCLNPFIDSAWEDL